MQQANRPTARNNLGVMVVPRHSARVDRRAFLCCDASWSFRDCGHQTTTGGARGDCGLARANSVTSRRGATAPESTLTANVTRVSQCSDTGIGLLEAAQAGQFKSCPDGGRLGTFPAEPAPEQIDVSRSAALCRAPAEADSNVC